MRPKIIILLSAIACIGGIVFFLACKYTYEFKVTELKEKAKETFTEALDKELKNRNINGDCHLSLILNRLSLLKCLIQFIGKMRQEDIYIGWIQRKTL